MQEAIHRGLIGKALHAQQLSGDGIGAQLMVDVSGAAHGQRAEEGLEFLQRGVIESFDGHLEVFPEGLKESGAQGEGHPQSQSSGGQDILERVGGADDLAALPLLQRVAREGCPYRVFFRSTYRETSHFRHQSLCRHP